MEQQSRSARSTDVERPAASELRQDQHRLGGRLGRVDGRLKVTGAARYTADVELPGTLWGAVLRSPYPRARIVRIDASRARELKGVQVVLTGAEVPESLYGRSFSDIPILAREVARFAGDRVAAVAAESRETAEEALGLIEVEYEELPAALDATQSLRPDAPLIHPDYLTYRGAPSVSPGHNVCSYEEAVKGDLEQGFAEADLIFEHSYSTPLHHQGYLEPHTCLVDCRPDGSARVWASNKAPFLVRDELARAVGQPPEQVVVEQTYVGGDFGGKGSAMELPIAYFLSKASGRPVRIVLSQVEEFTAANPRHPSEMTIRTGLKLDGRIVARDIKMLFDGGAYAGYKPIPGAVLAARHWAGGVYRVPNLRFSSTIAYSNRVPGGHMRSPGGAQAAFGTELDIDRLARAVGLDPLQFRLLNAMEEGELGPLGEEWKSYRLKECLELLARAAGWDQPKAPGVGRGIAVSACSGGMGGSEALVEVASDGSATLVTGVNDQGSGSHTMLSQIVAHELRLPIAQVKLRLGSTQQVPWDSGSSASRVTYVAGLATRQAATEARNQLGKLASEYLGCPEEAVELGDDGFHDRSNPTSSLSFAELAARAIEPGQPLAGRGRFVNYGMTEAPSIRAVVAEVEVDRETGTPHLRRVFGAHDVGTVLNEIGLTGQIEGGLIQGLGYGLMEELRVSNGRVETVGLNDFKLPTYQDLPPLESILVTDAPGDGPYGAKPIGELSNVLLPPAIANAVYDAVGVWITDLPITAEKIYRALRASGKTT